MQILLVSSSFRKRLRVMLMLPPLVTQALEKLALCTTGLQKPNSSGKFAATTLYNDCPKRSVAFKQSRLLPGWHIWVLGPPPQLTRKRIRVKGTMRINADFKVILFRNDTSSGFTIRIGLITFLFGVANQFGERILNTQKEISHCKRKRLSLKDLLGLLSSKVR